MPVISAHNVDKEIYTIARCLKELIVNNNLDEALENIVEWLAETLNISRCYISEAGSVKGYNNQVSTIYAGSKAYKTAVEIQGQNLFLNTSEFPQILSILESNKTFKVSINDTIGAGMFRFLQASGLQSLLLVPLLSDKKYWGFIGFGDSISPRTWRKSENELVSLANAIGFAKEKNRYNKEIIEKNEVYNSTLSGLKELVWEIDLINHTTKTTGDLNLFKRSAQATDTQNIMERIFSLIHPGDAARIKTRFAELLLKENNTVEEEAFRVLDLKDKNGKYLWIHSRHRLTKNNEGIAISISGSLADITGTKEVSLELEKQKEQYQFLVENIGQVIFTLDERSNFTYLSNSWLQMLGYRTTDCIGQNFINYIPQEEILHFWKSFGSIFSNNQKTFDQQMQMLDINGNKIWVRIVAKSIKDAENRVTGVFGSIENINNKYSSELILKESNEKLFTILNNSKEIILTIDLENKQIENVNDAISILGYTPDEWIGQNYKSWSNKQRKTFHELMKLAVQGQLQVSNQQISFSNKSETEVITFEFSTSIFSYKNSRYLLCVLRDISERIVYEQNLARLTNQLSHLINNIDDVYAIYDLPTSRFEFVSNNMEALYGCSKKDFIKHGITWNEIIHLEDLPGVKKSISSILKSKTKGEFFYRITTPVGEVKMILEKITIGKNEKGKPEKLYIVKTDYTHIENVERSFIESERKFRFISENISDFISIHDPDWNFTYASPSVKNILGYEPDEIIGLGGFDLVHPDDMMRTLDELLEPLVLEHKETQLRYRLKAKDGGYKWVETYSKAVLDAKNETSSIISSTRDVTAQVIAETMLKTSEEQYRLLSENSNDVIAVYNLDGAFTYVSPSSLQVLGYSPCELVGNTVSDTLAKDPDNKELVNNNIRQIIIDRETKTYIYKVLTKNGSEKSLEVIMQPVLKNNEVIAIQAASRDVTEREKLLLELEQSLIKERELNELRSMFVSTASHQFRTPLTVIQSGVEIMEMYLEDLPETKQVRFKRQFGKIQDEVDRLEFLMNDILLLGRANAARTPFNPEVLDLVSFTQDIIDNKFNNRYNDDRKILFAIAGDPVTVECDPKLISHSIENILNNAYKYSEFGNLNVQLIFTNGFVKISMTDQGMGIPMEDQKNLFQPFYRATNTSEIDGTGLGLAIVKEFVDKHDGKIIITSKLNKGTTVDVILPVKQKSL